MAVRTQRDTLLSFFPPPRFLAMPAVGLDVSDYTIKFIEFVSRHHERRVGRFGEISIERGINVNGEIKNPQALTDALRALREEHHLEFVRLALPEEHGYVFETEVPATTMEDIRGSLEFKLEENVPIAPADAVIGYDVLKTVKPLKANHIPVTVSVFPRAHVESYAAMLRDAGLTPLSFEIEPQAIARAVVPQGDYRTYLVLDIGRERTGIEIVSGRVVQLAATISIGSEHFTRALLGDDTSSEKAKEMKNTIGISGNASGEAHKELLGVLDRLAGETRRYVAYWDTHGEYTKTPNPPVVKILLCGGGANLAGLSEYLDVALGVPAAPADVWANAFSLEEYIPPIAFRDSLGYASAIGLALRGSREGIDTLV